MVRENNIRCNVCDKTLLEFEGEIISVDIRRYDKDFLESKSMEQGTLNGL